MTKGIGKESRKNITVKPDLDQGKIIEQARSVDIVSLLRRLNIYVPSENQRPLIRCFRPENHKNNDIHPSMHIDRRKNTVRCYVCDRKPMDTIDVVRMVNGCSFSSAIAFLTHKHIGRYVPKSERDNSKVKRWREEVGRILKCSTNEELLSLDPNTGAATRLVQQQNKSYASLSPPSFDMVKYYVEERGIDMDTFVQSGIRFCNPKTHSISGFDPNLIRNHPAAIPHSRIFSRSPVLYFHLRALSSDLNPKEVFVKKCPMFATFNAPGRYGRGELCFVCEGHIDALTAASRGFNAISLPGGITSWRDFYAVEFKKSGLIPVLAFDSEPEADRKAYEVLGELLAEGVLGYRIALPPNEDINSWFLRCERAVVRQLRIDMTLLDPSMTAVGELIIPFSVAKNRYFWEGEWKSRYIDQHSCA